MIGPSPRFGALLLCLAVGVAACGLPGDGGGSVEPTFEFRAAGLEFPVVGLPHTPDPAVDPAEPEPQVVLAPVFVDAVEVTAGTGQLEVSLIGHLPTPCHRLRLEVGAPDPDGLVHLNVWAEADADQICIQVMEPFTESVGIEGLGEGTYTLLIAGEKLGEVVSSFEQSQ